MPLRPKISLQIAAVLGALLVLIAGTWACRHFEVRSLAAVPAGKPSPAVAEPVTAASTPAPVSEPQAGMSPGPEVIAASPSEPEADGDEASALASVVDSQLAGFHEGISLGQWIGTRDKSDNWHMSDDKVYLACRTYTNTKALPSGLQVTSTLYFYPPDAPTPAVFPIESGQRLIDRTCRLAEVQVRTPATIYRNGHFLEQFLEQHLGEKYGPGISLKGTRYRFEKDAAGWKAGSIEIFAVYNPLARDNNGVSMAAVEVSARLPAAYDDDEKPDYGMKTYRYRSIENDQFHRAIALAAVDASLGKRMSKIFEAVFEASATPQGAIDAAREHATPATLAAFRDWMAATKNLPVERRAAGLYVADRLMVHLEAALGDEDKPKIRSGFEKLGAEFDYYDPCGCYRYMGSWWKKARGLDPEGTISQMAVLVALARNTAPTIGRDSQLGMFSTVIADGEWLLSKKPDPANAAQIHFIIGDAYSDMVALAGGSNPDYGESFTQQEGEEARDKALQQYRLGLAVDSTSENARDAWLQAWHLRAGLLPETRFVFEGD
jgi:hypothetical protein